MSLKEAQERIAQLSDKVRQQQNTIVALRKALEERSKVNIVYTKQTKVSEKTGLMKLEVIPICIADQSEEGKKMYVELVDKLQDAEDGLPQDLDWASKIEIPVNELHHLPDGLIL